MDLLHTSYVLRSSGKRCNGQGEVRTSTQTGYLRTNRHQCMPLLTADAWHAPRRAASALLNCNGSGESAILKTRYLQVACERLKRRPCCIRFPSTCCNCRDAVQASGYQHPAPAARVVCVACVACVACVVCVARPAYRRHARAVLSLLNRHLLR